MTAPDLAGATVAITGATGFLGPHLVEAFTRAGARVRVLARPASDVKRLAEWRPEIVTGDVLSPASLDELFRDSRIAVHAAGVVLAKDQEAYRRANVDGTRNAVRAAAAARCGAFLLISSLAAAGPAHAGRPPRTEEDGPDPRSWYGRSKRDAEAAVEREGGAIPRCALLRAGAIYGPWDRAFLAYFKMVRAGVKPVIGAGDRTFQPVFAPDVAEAAVAATAAPEGCRAYFLVPRQAVTWNRFGAAIEEAVGKPAFRLRLPEALVRPGLLERIPFMQAAADRFKDFICDRWEADPSRAERELGWTARTPLADGLAATLRWYRDRNWL